jgi:16S rRNA (guanine(966)-N(2))-methyltransferase RsmD
MRIISGQYGRRRFQTPASFKARPTTDFAKESLFNVLVHLIDLDGTEALDLFAGTGSITFELISRGCRRVTAVEQDRVHAAFIAKVAGELHTQALQLIKGDAFRFLNTAPPQTYDFIFADPPYSMKNLVEIPRLVFEKNLLRDGGVFVIEHSKAYDFSSFPFFNQHRSYGAVNFSFFNA